MDNDPRRAPIKAPQSLLLFAAAAGGIVVFTLAAALATAGEPMAFDRGMLLALRHTDAPGVPIGPHWLLPAAREVTALGGTPLLTLLTLTLVGYFAVKRQPKSIAILLVAVIGETLLSDFLKDLFGRPRPEIVPHLINVSSKSFPSGHSTSAAAIYFTLAALIARETKERVVRNYVFFLAAILAALVGASRVYLGVHYPTDVVGGLGAGAAWAAIVLIAARRFG